MRTSGSGSQKLGVRRPVRLDPRQLDQHPGGPRTADVAFDAMLVRVFGMVYVIPRTVQSGANATPEP
jgi:hypothetical protein